MALQADEHGRPLYPRARVPMWYAVMELCKANGWGAPWQVAGGGSAIWYERAMLVARLRAGGEGG